MKTVSLGVLVSGGGSNLQSIIDHIENGRLSAQITIVVSNDPQAGGLERATRHGIKTAVVNHRDFSSRALFEEALIQVLKQHDVELVILAGFMRILTDSFLRAFPKRVMNIHPALLPSFPGTHVWQDQLDYGVKVAGCTVHFVDEGTDTGPIIIQAVVPVMEDDTADSLSSRILTQEHRIFPRAIQLYTEGRLTIQDRRVVISPPPSPNSETVLINPPLSDIIE
jgi:phosphoribosylglycinamide formyltransferase 1